MLREKSEKFLVLIVIDSEEESFFLERALRQSSRFHVIGSVRNGEEAIAYLSGGGTYADRQLWPLPHVLLMEFSDVSGGKEVIEWCRRQTNRELRGVDLSNSAIKADIQRIKALGTEAFSPNTSQHAQLLRLVSSLEDLLLAARPF